MLLSPWRLLSNSGVLHISHQQPTVSFAGSVSFAARSALFGAAAASMVALEAIGGNLVAGANNAALLQVLRGAAAAQPAAASATQPPPPATAGSLCNRSSSVLANPRQLQCQLAARAPAENHPLRLSSPGTQQAFNEGTLGVSWGVAGFILPYLAGIHYMLTALGVINMRTPVAGASSGSLVAGFSCANVSEADFRAGFSRMSDFCRAHHNCQQILDDELRKTVRGFLPPEAYKTCTNVGSLTITVGVFPPKKGLTRGMQVGEFTSNEDLLDAAMTACYIPVWSGKTLTTTFRSEPAYDGFFFDGQPCPPGVTYCIKMGSRTPSFSAKRLPEFFGLLGGAASLGTGRRARLATPPEGGLAPVKPREAPNIDNFNIALQEDVDIAPGIFSDTGITDEAWSEMVVLPGDQAINDHLFELGQTDGKAWAKATGLLQAAEAKRARKAKAKAGGSVTQPRG